MTTDFTWIRHGQTSANLAGIVQGHLDFPLDELGLEQGRCAARRLEDEPFDHVFTSDLLRARQTAELIAAGRGLPVEPLEALREWNLGEMQGCTKEQIRTRCPGIMEAFLLEREEVIVPGGESHLQFYRRVADCLDSLAMKHPGQRLLIVTHGGTLRAIYRHVAGPVSPNAMLPVTSNAAYGRFLRHEHHWQIVTWNDVSHLKDVGFRQSLTF